MSRILSKLYQTQIDLRGTSRARYTLKQLLRWTRRQILKFYDPTVTIKIGDSRGLRMPLSHRAPELIAENVYYDQVLDRLVRFLKEDDGPVVVVDVGANIGDTARILVEAGADKVICIEGDQKYYNFLSENWSGDPRVVSHMVMLSDRDDQPVSTVHYSGTAFPVGGVGNGQASKSLDSVIASNGGDGIAVLKIDTDGYDLKVLRGARKLLADQRPAIFFEYSPEHYEKLGEVDPLETFPFLSSMGYKVVSFYDSAGYPFLTTESANIAIVKQLSEYAIRKGLYFDVLTFPDERSGRFSEFLNGESLFVPKFNRSYLPPYAVSE